MENKEIFKKQTFEKFIFDLNNINQLNQEIILKILDINAVSLIFHISEKDFVSHFISLGFVQLKKSKYDLQFKLENFFIKLTYNFSDNFCNKIFIYKLKTNTHNVEFHPNGNIKHRYYYKNVKNKLKETFAMFSYSSETTNGISNEYISSISYFFEDTRKLKLKNFKLYAILEYPFEHDNFKFSVFDPIYCNLYSNQTLKISNLIKDFKDKDVKLFNSDAKYRYELINLNSIFTEEEISILNMISYS